MCRSNWRGPTPTSAPTRWPSGEPGILAEAAALARASATDAYLLAAQESLHVHGGVGFTWACEAHLHLRRARALEAALGSAALWRERLIETPAASATA